MADAYPSPWTICLYKGNVQYQSVVVDIPPDAKPQRLTVQGIYSIPMISVDPAQRESFYGIDRSVEETHMLVPWQDIEEIAAFVRGDGTDLDRTVLADAILEGRR